MIFNSFISIDNILFCRFVLKHIISSVNPACLPTRQEDFKLYCSNYSNGIPKEFNMPIDFIKYNFEIT